MITKRPSAMGDPTIVALQAFRVSMGLRSGFSISKTALHEPGALAHVIVRLETSDGVVGYGEGVAIPALMGVTGAGILEAINYILKPRLMGKSLFGIASVHEEMDLVLSNHQPAKAAIDIALYDAAAQTLGISIAELIGGRVRRAVNVTQPIGIGSPEDIARMAGQAVSDGIGHLKLKLSGGDQDKAVVEAAREAVGGDPLIRLDANGGYRSAQEALSQLRMLAPYDRYLIEQPLVGDDLLGMSYLRSRLGSPLVADESCRSLQDGYRVVRAGAADILSIKVQEAGGIYKALQLVAFSEAAATPILIGARMESGIGAAANLQLIAALPHLKHACDLMSTDTYEVSLIHETLIARKGSIEIPPGPGLGVQVDEAAVKELSQRVNKRRGSWPD